VLATIGQLFLPFERCGKMQAFDAICDRTQKDLPAAGALVLKVAVAALLRNDNTVMITIENHQKRVTYATTKRAGSEEKP
jgi:hypothetical protein